MHTVVTPQWLESYKQLAALYHQWRILTQAEGEGINAQNWQQVEQRQAEKKLLQFRISEAADALQAVLLDEGINPEPIKQEFRNILNGLIEQELDNQKALEVQRQRNLAQQAALDKTTNTLRQIHGAYGGKRESVWHSYS